MRLKKGSKVEVLKKSNVPPGSWWCAEIVSGNGHTYNVKYDQSPSNISEVITERVPRKVIRPCPPPFEGAGSWVPGGIVEVFEMSSWKLAEVSRRVSRNHHFVRLLGSSSEFKVHKSFIRVRQSWKDGRWVLIGKDSGKLNNDKLIRPPKAGVSPKSGFQLSGFQLPLSDESMKGCPGDDYCPIEKCIPSDEYHCRKKRRSPLVTCIANGKKLKAAAKDDGCPQLIPECSSHLPEKGQSWRLVKLASTGPMMIVGAGCDPAAGMLLKEVHLNSLKWFTTEGKYWAQSFICLPRRRLCSHQLHHPFSMNPIGVDDQAVTIANMSISMMAASIYSPNEDCS